MDPKPPFPNLTQFPPYLSAHESWPAELRYMDHAARCQELGRTWRTWGLSTKPANRQLAEAGIVDFYRHRGLKGLPWIYWATSPPHAMRLVRDELVVGAKPLQRDEYMPQAENGELNHFQHRFWGTARLAMSGTDPIRTVGIQLMNAAVPDIGALRTESSVMRLDSGYVPLRVAYGQFDAEALARYETVTRDAVDGTFRSWQKAQNQSFSRPWTNLMQDAPEIVATNRDAVHALMQIASNAGPWLPFQESVVICERPEIIRLDDQQRLHADDGPAAAYRDGWKVHAWHGVRVPADLIEGPPWSAERILTEPNTEVRRAAIERVGWETFIDSGLLKPVGKPVPDPGNPGQLLSLHDAPDIYFRRVRVLLCTNGSPERDGTRRRFGLTVPGLFVDPIAAAAWMYGWTREQYAALQHRR
jgi:hypothetical protein